MKFKVNLDQHAVNSLVFACSDFRFREAVDSWIDITLNGKADLLVWPGPSKEIIENSDQVIEAVHTLRKLHGETKIYILDHIDCGAYSGSASFKDHEDELNTHRDKLAEAKNILQQAFPSFQIEGYILDKENVVKLT